MPQASNSGLACADHEGSGSSGDTAFANFPVLDRNPIETAFLARQRDLIAGRDARSRPVIGPGSDSAANESLPTVKP